MQLMHILMLLAVCNNHRVKGPDSYYLFKTNKAPFEYIQPAPIEN